MFLSQRIDSFLEDARKKVKGMTDEEFKKMAKAVEVNLTKKHLNLKQRVGFFWGRICDRTYNFTCKEDTPAIIATIKREEVQEMFERIFFGLGRVIEYHVCSEGHKEQNDTERLKAVAAGATLVPVETLEEFKKKLDYHEDHMRIEE